MNRPDVLDHALVARIGGPRQEEWADGRNPFARPHPELPWVDRGLPTGSSCWMALAYGPDCGGVEIIGHEGHRNDFAHPPVIPGPKRVAVDRPERVA